MTGIDYLAYAVGCLKLAADRAKRDNDAAIRKHPDCEDRCQLNEHKGYPPCWDHCEWDRT